MARGVIEILEKELERIRAKKENAIGYDQYRYFWEKEKRLEKLIERLKMSMGD